MATEKQGNAKMMILASGSAIRAELLRNAAVEFEVDPARVNEGAIKAQYPRAGETTEGTDALALALAMAKATEVSGRRDGRLVMGCDQILRCEGKLYDKPRDLTEARTHLQSLAGKRHVLHTAVVLRHGARVVWSHIAHPGLTIRAFSPEFLDAYLAFEGKAALQSVGAYRLEGMGVQLFAAIEGEYSAVLGLPLLPVMEALRQIRALPA